MSRIPGSLEVTIVKILPGSTVRSLPTDAAAPAPELIVKQGCHVETKSQTENVGLFAINTELVWIFMPPDADTVAITSTDVLRFADRDYQMLGPSSMEYGIDGDVQQVWCIARWEAS